MSRRRFVLDQLGSGRAADGDTLHNELAQLERVLLDVRSGRVTDFILEGEPAIHASVSAD